MTIKAVEYNQKPAAPASSRPLPSGVKNTIGRGFGASTSRMHMNRPVKHASTASFSGSAGPVARVPSVNARPKSAYGSHGRSKSHHQGMRPATAMKQRDEDEDEDDASERKGVHPSHLSTIPKDFLHVSKHAPRAQKRPNSLNVPPRRVVELSHPRFVSSPSNLRSITPVMEEPADTSCDDICTTLGELTLGNPKAVTRDSPVGRGTIPGKEPNPFLLPQRARSQLPRATPARQCATPTPVRPPSSTPRKQAPFLNRFTNERCPDFYDDRIAAMEREFLNFKEKMEGGMQQATNYQDTIQQLQARVTELETIRTRLETVNRGLETELKDTQSCFTTVKMELEMTKRNHSFETDELNRKLRNEVDDLQSRHEKDARRMRRDQEDAEEKTRKDYEGRIDKLLKAHSEELAELRKKIDAESEAERMRRTQDAQEKEAEYASKLRMAAVDADVKQREMQLVQGELINVKAELDRERSLKTGLQGQLTEATTNNLTLDAANKAMKEKIDFLESDSQAQSQAFNDLHRRMQEAIDAAERAHEKLRQEETLRRKLFNQVQELKGNIRVMCRVRPVHAHEADPASISFPDNDTDSKEVAVLGPSKQSATGKDITASYAYSFDRVFGPDSQNAEVFEEISQLVQSALDGYNVCIFCYGQTGSGKTYTMSSLDGMIPRAVAQIYAEAQRLEEKGWRYTMLGSFIEVYNETYNDLLGRSEDLDKKKVEVRHDQAKKQTYLENVVSVALDGPERVDEILDTASKNRTVAATKANMRSSRSHSVFILKLVGTNEITGEKSEGTLNLVDLAGSERLEHSKAEGARLKETQNINKSLSCLGDVINALGSSKEGAHIPYRNSKLTYLLQYSLGGNSKTLMFVMVSPLQAHLQETVTSLKFATKVHNTHIGTAKKQTKSLVKKEE
ncbi:P-loop containing nucleoside triphosphate hydrolase protein [Paraphoma chrysanthemicola]|nr:P-loop containing nucleoside triphosphate hydrolase protein [Paraphoma chrysanthemicola]